ncbi:E3 ubiquitin-protein ligase SINA-like 11 [Lolium rigidum]|uniref:E3 ubiquitin-protein ligase SINA-like 11 n=1 Tax=Lolium rigidum TaxID=89674 RepID=UPI001F5C5424|nr:E3 ubiquitin-protein ligase SINA-like 11 [Lolium rigidum]
MALPAKRKPLKNVTVEDADTLDCGVCYRPLKPPVFQCAVGHAICSLCRDKIVASGRSQQCHVCRVPLIGGYQRCIALEKVLESISMPCENAAHGCGVRPAHYDHGEHARACPHKPCYCPADACGFAGSTAALLGHLAAAHGWPCTTDTRPWVCVKVNLRDGFNAVSVHASGQQHLFLLNVARSPFGRAISVSCVHPHQTVGFEVRLKYSRNENAHGGGVCRGHSQQSQFTVACTDLSGGPPSSDESFQFFLPKCVHPDFIRTIAATFEVLHVTISV